MLTLKRFFSSVEVTCSIGLIVKNPKKSWNRVKKEILSQLEWPYLTFEIKKETYPDDFLKTLVRAFRGKKWLIVFVRHTWFPGRIYNQLRLLSRMERIQIFNLRGEEDILEMKLPKESRIVLVMDSDNVYQKFELPNILDLFGPVYRI